MRGMVQNVCIVGAVPIASQDGLDVARGAWPLLSNVSCPLLADFAILFGRPLLLCHVDKSRSERTRGSNMLVTTEGVHETAMVARCRRCAHLSAHDTRSLRAFAPRRNRFTRSLRADLRQSSGRPIRIAAIRVSVSDRYKGRIGNYRDVSLTSSLRLALASTISCLSVPLLMGVLVAPGSASPSLRGASAHLL